MTSNAYFYKYLLSSQSLSEDEITQIAQLMKDSNQTLGSDLPIELYFNMGMNKAPVTIVCCMLSPEIFTLSAFMFLCWQMLLVYSETYPKDMMRSLFIRSGD
jgi:hypothetical protein